MPEMNLYAHIILESDATFQSFIGLSSDGESIMVETRDAEFNSVKVHLSYEDAERLASRLLELVSRKPI
jgi:hypothetical protein